MCRRKRFLLALKTRQLRTLCFRKSFLVISSNTLQISPGDTAWLRKRKCLKDVAVVSVRSEPCEMKERSSVLFQQFYFIGTLRFSDIPTNQCSERMLLLMIEFSTCLCVSTLEVAGMFGFGVNMGCCQKGRCLSCLSSFTTSPGFLFRLAFNSNGVTNAHSLDEGKPALFAAAAAGAQSGCGA